MGLSSQQSLPIGILSIIWGQQHWTFRLSSRSNLGSRKQSDYCHKTHTLAPGYLYLKGKGKSAKSSKMLEKDTLREACAATFLACLEAIHSELHVRADERVRSSSTGLQAIRLE